MERQRERQRLAIPKGARAPKNPFENPFGSKFTLCPALLISSARVRFFQNRKKILDPEIEPVVLHTINPMNSKKFIMTL